MLKKLLILIIFAIVGVSLFSFAKRSLFAAAGDFVNIGTAGGTDASSDGITWSPGFPIMIDSYGKYIVMENRNTGGTYSFEYSNDQTTWSEAATSTGLGIRVSSVYDSIHDRIHVIQANGTAVKYYRYKIVRDKNYNITNIVADPNLTAMTLDSIGSCTAYDAAYPLLQFKDDGANGILVASWSIHKTCSAVSISETRASMRVLSNTLTDGTASNWKAPNGVDDSGTATGPASVPFNILYHYAGTSTHIFQESMFIRGGSGAKSNDLYYFNVDENDTNGFRRLAWNSASSDWSGTWTTRATFGGNVGNSNGYNLKNELISKPVYDSAHDRVYVGIARWLDATNGDTQSLYYIDSTDTATLAGNVYSAGGAAWFAPTMDIMYNSDDSKIYYFFESSSKDPNTGATNTALNGKGFYKTYDGSSFSTATQFFSVTGYTIDIPIVYQAPTQGRILLVFRADGAEGSSTPPHNIYWGYLNSGGSTSIAAQSITSPLSATTVANFDKICTTKTATEIIDNGGGEVALASSLRDDFSTPLSPYYNISSLWTEGTWSGGNFIATPSGTVNVWGTSGAYIYGNSTFSQKTLEFRAKFTNNNFQHIGWDDGNAFGTFIMFSTNNNAQLNARVGATQYTLGASYLGSYHIYKITWATSDIKFYIDGVQVASDTTNITTALNPIISNNTTTTGADLLVDWINVVNYPTTTGTFVSCALDSSTAGAVWGAITYTASASGVTVKTRTSTDNTTWTAWSSALNSGDTIPSTAGRYLQYQVGLTGTSTTTPTLDNVSLTFSAPVPTATPTPTPTATPTPTPTSSTSSSPSSYSPPACTNGLPGGRPDLFQVDTTGTTATLYFSPVSSNADKYTVVFGYTSGDGRFNASMQHGPDSGVLSYTLNDLSPNTTYYVKLRADNGCKPGEWGNEMKITTARNSSSGLRFYKNFLTWVFSFFPRKVTSVGTVPQANATSTSQAATKNVCQTYTVGVKDTLWSIATKTFGSGTKYSQIISANKASYPSLGNSTTVHAGWKLKIGC